MLDFNRISFQLDAPFLLTNNAPVTRVSWSALNLPEGLTLSEAGLLSGHPTTAGTFNGSVSVTTNWGTNSNILRIVIE